MSYRQLKRTAVKSTVLVELAVIVGVTGFMILNGVSLLTDRLAKPDIVMGAAPIAASPAERSENGTADPLRPSVQAASDVNARLDAGSAADIATPLRALSGTPVLPPNAHGLVDPGSGLSAISGYGLQGATAGEASAMDALCSHLERGEKASRWTWADAGKTPIQVLTGLLRYEQVPGDATWQAAPSAVATDDSPVLSFLSCQDA